MINIKKIILISGKAGSGKDSTANILKQKLESKNNKVLITHMADLLKYIVKTYFNWNGEKDEIGRYMFQYIGTDVIRKQNPNYWVDFIIGILTMFENEWDYVLIPDVRFINELERFAGFDTVNLRINRLNFISHLTEKQQNHISETELDDYEFDYIINSESGLDKLEIEVDRFIEWLEKNNEYTKIIY